MQNHLNSHTPPPPGGGESLRWRECLKERVFSPTSPALEVKTLCSHNHLYLKQLKMVHYRIKDRYNRHGPVPNRYTIHQSTLHVLSVYQDHSIQEEGKKEIFPPTHI